VHGFDGPVQSSYPVFQFESIKNFFRGWAELGVKTPTDPGAGIKSGAFWAPSSLDPKDETRSYARAAHYDLVINSRPNYHLIPSNAVTKIIIKSSHATGVQFVDRKSGNTAFVAAEKEVIVAAGTLHSSQILQLSGIGSKNTLQPLGIDTLVDLPGVGCNFQDQPTLYPIFNFTKRTTISMQTLGTDPTYASDQLKLYYEKRQGPYTIVHQGGNTVAFLPLPQFLSEYPTIVNQAGAIDVDSLYPEFEPNVLAGYGAQRSLILKLYSSTTTALQETGWNSDVAMPITMLKPLSRGTITINSTDPLADPVVDFASLTFPTDIEILIAALRINRKFMDSEAMQELGAVEISPGANITSDEDLKEVFRNLVQPTYSHPCCTCPMMPRELGGVVGPDLKVYGVDQLSVIDASIMPIIPSAHLSATVYAVAEKAADIMKARHGWRP
jgi:choline dehydrogenase-like flavoprotein